MRLGHAIGALGNRGGEIGIERTHFRLENRPDIRRTHRCARTTSTRARKQGSRRSRWRIDLARHRLEIQTLQTTTEGVDVAACGDLTPQSVAKIRQHVRNCVDLALGSGHRFHLDHALETVVRHDAAERTGLRIADTTERAVRFDLAEHAFVEQPRRRGECIVEQELQRFFLTRRFNVAEYCALLANEFLLLVLAAYDARDMPHLLRPLTNRAAIDLFHVVVRRPFLPCGCRFDELHRALEILYTQH